MGYRSWEALLLVGHQSDEQLTEKDFELVARLLDCEPAALKAVQRVETGGRGGFFAPDKPAILFEGHIFWEFPIMGFNHAACGESSVESFVNAMCVSEFKQLLLSERFIKQAGM